MLNSKPLIYFESLGCDKNLVDSEVMLGMLMKKGYAMTLDESEADAVIINTCSFIHDAKEESVNTILRFADMKKEGKLKAIVVVGCLTQLYKDEVTKEIEEVDAILGAANYDRIEEALDAAIGHKEYAVFDPIDRNPEVFIERSTETTKHYAYLKISEGCDNHCTYCIIPSLRGKFRSRTIESLVEETKYLAMQGKTELILVAQDVGKYGLDLYGEKRLPELLGQLSEVEGIHWIRLLYVYPEDVNEPLIQAMKHNEKVVPYIDMPLQHVSDPILKMMARKTRNDKIHTIIDSLRAEVPGICIRTTFIVGFPGETQANYDELKGFIEDQRIDRVGVFSYSREENTPAYNMEGQIDDQVKEARRDELMLLQQEISLSINEGIVGDTLEVMVEGYIPADDVYFGRSYRDTPDVDGYVFFESESELLSGDYVNIKITEANEYDLIGDLV